MIYEIPALLNRISTILVPTITALELKELNIDIVDSVNYALQNAYEDGWIHDQLAEKIPVTDITSSLASNTGTKVASDSAVYNLSQQILNLTSVRNNGGDVDLSDNELPTVDKNNNPIPAGMIFTVIAGGFILNLEPFDDPQPGDILYSKIDNPTLPEHWTAWRGNSDLTNLWNELTLLWAQVNLRLRISDIANNLTTITAGKALDARQGKIINDAIAVLTAAIPNFQVTSEKVGNLTNPNTSTYIHTLGLLEVLAQLQLEFEQYVDEQIAANPGGGTPETTESIKQKLSLQPTDQVATVAALSDLQPKETGKGLIDTTKEANIPADTNTELNDKVKKPLLTTFNLSTGVIKLDRNRKYRPVIISQTVAISIDGNDADEYQASIIAIGDGTHDLTFSNLLNMGDEAFDKTNGMGNHIMFFRGAEIDMYRIIKQANYTADITKPTLVSAVVNP